MMNLIIFLEFLKLVLNKLQNIFMYQHNLHARFSDNIIIWKLQWQNFDFLIFQWNIVVRIEFHIITTVMMMLRTFYMRLIIRFIKIIKWIRTVKIISRFFYETFDLFLDDFQNFFDLITDLIFVFKIDFMNRFLRKQFRFRFEYECFKLDLEAVWSLAEFTDKELCQFLWHLAWSWCLNWWLIIVLSRLLSCLFAGRSLRKLLHQRRSCEMRYCRVCSEM